MKKLIIFAVALAAMASCAKESSSYFTPEGGEGAVNFTASVASRVTDTSFDENDKIGIYMYDKTNDQGLDAQNEVYTYNAQSKFEGVVDIFYPTSGNDVWFSAYYPYDATINGVYHTIKITGDDYKPNTVTLPFLEAYTTEAGYNKTAPNSNVSLTFKHRLTYMKLNIEPGDGLATDFTSDFKITKINITDIPVSGDYLLKTRVFNGEYSVNDILVYSSDQAFTGDEQIGLYLLPTYDNRGTKDDTSDDIADLYSLAGASLNVFSTWGEFHADMSSLKLVSNTEFTCNLTLNYNGASIEGSIVEWVEGEGDLSLEY